MLEMKFLVFSILGFMESSAEFWRIPDFMEFSSKYPENTPLWNPQADLNSVGNDILWTY